MSNTKKCSLCEKEYTAILPNCPNCLCPANNKVVSNTDKLQEIKERWDEGRGLISTDAIEFLISQLEQAQGEIQHSKKLHFDSAQLLTGQMLKIELLEKENERLNDEVSQVRDNNRRLCNWNEQLKADKQKLVEACENMLHGAEGGYMLAKPVIKTILTKVLSEVKGKCI